MKYFRILLAIVLMNLSTLAIASGIRIWEINQNLEASYNTVYESLEKHRFFVVFEPNIQKNIAGFAEKWGDDYNRNKLEGIRSMVFCNGWYANQVSNADPDMMAMCPLHITLIQKEGKTRILFIKPTHVAEGSEAMKIAAEIEADVAVALDEATAQLNTGTTKK